MPEPAPPPETPTLFEQEAAMLRSLAPQDEDAEGLLAFALHRRAVLDWAMAFAQSEGHSPGPDETRRFLLGEATARRQQDYKERASLLLALQREGVEVQPAKPPVTTRKQKIFPWGPGMGFVVEQPTGPLNIRLLILRLIMLLLAVIVTALMLRFFVVHP